MDLNRIFVKNCCPTKVGGQAILEGLMMRGSRALAIAVRKPNGNIHLTVEPLPQRAKWKKIPILRGVVSFVESLYTGTTILFYGADLIEKWDEEAQAAQTENKDDEKKKSEGLEKGAILLSVVLSLVLVVGLFMLLPTFILNLVREAGLTNVILLNLLEGLVRIIIFVAYISACSLMPEIKRTFEYHGAEHKTIHCYESGLELTPENAQTFYTLHPRCGTSFMMFVMVIAILVHAFFGWPTLWLRLLTRIGSLPIIAGLSYELLQFTGRHGGKLVQILSLPGILLQKVTTNEPTLDELEVAIVAMKAVLPSHEDANVPVDYWVGEVLSDGTYVKDEEETLEYIKTKEKLK